MATDYFTKWVEAIPLKNVTSKDMIEFVKEHIIYRFGIPQTITTDQDTMFTSGEFEEFATSMGIKLLNSSPYYAQANDQAEASNKGIIKLIKERLMSNLGVGTPHSMRLCGHMGWLVMGILRCLRISWHMGMKPFFPGN